MPLLCPMHLVVWPFGHFDASSWRLCLNYAAPFDIRTIPVWFLMWVIQFNVCLGYTACMTTLTSFFVGCCFYIKAMCDHVNLIMHELQSDIERNRTIETNHQKISNHLIEAVKLHIQIFEYVNNY